MLILLLISIILEIIFQLKSLEKIRVYTEEIAKIFIPYFLLITLVNYGFEKLIMQQFYAPQSNILHTPFGYLDKDILFWSTIGTSKSYNLFLGISQIITASLLLFKRTRIVGFIASIVLFVNIVAINFCFDISVKILSVFLLFISFVGLIPYVSNLKKLFRKNQQTTKKHQFLYAFGKTFFILFFVFQIVYPYFKTSNEKQVLSGGYQVLETFKNDSLVKNTIKRLFFHSKGFIIFQDNHDKMSDYKFHFLSDNQFTTTDYTDEKTNFKYHKNDKKLILNFTKNKSIYKIEAVKINENLLPVNQNNFHWTIDDIK